MTTESAVSGGPTDQSISSLPPEPMTIDANDGYTKVVAKSNKGKRKDRDEAIEKTPPITSFLSARAPLQRKQPPAPPQDLAPPVPNPPTSQSKPSYLPNTASDRNDDTETFASLALQLKTSLHTSTPLQHTDQSESNSAMYTYWLSMLIPFPPVHPLPTQYNSSKIAAHFRQVFVSIFLYDKDAVFPPSLPQQKSTFQSLDINSRPITTATNLQKFLKPSNIARLLKGGKQLGDDRYLRGCIKIHSTLPSSALIPKLQNLHPSWTVVVDIFDGSPSGLRLAL